MPAEKGKLIAAVLISVLVTALIVTPIVLWAVTRTKGTVNNSCTTDTDCSNNGLCVNGACKCNSPWGGPFCNVLGNLKDAALVSGQGIACSQVPTPCKVSADCSVCTQDTEYSCQTVSASQNSKGLSGSYCLPTPPTDECLTGAPGSDSIPGFYLWQGWADVETMQWTCNCEFPNFYPYTTDACIKSPQVCQHGNWTYPCLRDPKNPLTCLNQACNPDGTCPDPSQECVAITEGKKVCQVKQQPCQTVSDCPGCGTATYPPYNQANCKPDDPNSCGYTPDQITAQCGIACVANTCQKTCKVDSDCGSYPCVNGTCATSPATLVGSNPFEYGMCDCSSQSCSSDADCAGHCFQGTCVGQRVAMGPNGVPTCVKDTCAPGGMFVPLDTPPYTYGYCDCSTGYSPSGNTCVYNGTEAPTAFCPLGCGHGKCVGPAKCTCDSGWNGNAVCTKFSCDLPNGAKCGHGTCIGPNTCACDPGFKTDANGACTVPA